jgi:RHS repeat-associated protein
MISATMQTATYVDYDYDAQNRRIWIWPGTQDSGGNMTNYTVNFYTPGGQKLGAYILAPWLTQNSHSMQVTLSSSDQYFGGRRLAPMDQLGSVVNSSQSYFPWGETNGTSNPQDTWNFATYWQDSVTGLDYANNRYYSNAYGRFMTPDPSSSSQDPRAPQTWNRYPYVVGDPVNGKDPSGLDCEGFSDGYSGCFSSDSGGGYDGGDWVAAGAAATQHRDLVVFNA